MIITSLEVNFLDYIYLDIFGKKFSVEIREEMLFEDPSPVGRWARTVWNMQKVEKGLEEISDEYRKEGKGEGVFDVLMPQTMVPRCGMDTTGSPYEYGRDTGITYKK